MIRGALALIALVSHCLSFPTAQSGPVIFNLSSPTLEASSALLPALPDPSSIDLDGFTEGVLIIDDAGGHPVV